jgi:hypothetical protein
VALTDRQQLFVAEYLKDLCAAAAARRGGAGDPWEVEEFEVVFWDKVQALDWLGRHLGLWQERPPLEALLDRLEPSVAGPLREALARHLAGVGATAEPPA